MFHDNGWRGSPVCGRILLHGLLKIWFHADPVDDAADAAGTRLLGSGYVAAPDGDFTLNQIAAINMATGTVTMTVKDLT